MAFDKVDREIITQYHQTRDAELREKLITQFLPLVHYTLGKLGISKEYVYEYDDLASQGILGLIDAFDRFDPKLNTQFSTYAIIKIRGKILDYLRSLDWLTRTARRRAKTINDAMNCFWEENQRMPSDSELAEALQMNLDEIQQGLMDSNRVIVSLDTYYSSDSEEENSLYETLADSHQADPLEIYDENETKERLVKAIKSLPEREQLILSLYYYDNLTFKEIGHVLKISESRVCQLHARATMSLKIWMSKEPDEEAKPTSPSNVVRQTNQTHTLPVSSSSNR
mgnify:CR=1 FL=1